MKIVQGDEAPVIERADPIRDGKFVTQPLLTGDEGSLGNFILERDELFGDFYSPRHRHNFDQWRFILEGELDYGRNGKMRPGVLGYFPEGAYYGPQTCKRNVKLVVAQFGGPSGGGFVGYEQMLKGCRQLKQYGVFSKGVFRRNEGVEGKKNMDAFQAIWEYVNGRPMAYPKSQYYDPLLINTELFQWTPVDGAPGVDEKTLGTFTDCNVRAARYRIQPGATLKAAGRGLFLVLSGRGRLEGEPFRPMTALHLETDESAAFKADETADILLLGLPDISLMKKEFEVSDDEPVLEAAE